MPNIYVTYSPNLPAKERLDDFIQQIHSGLAPIIATDVSSFKTYLIPTTQAVIGLGDKEKALMHVDFRMFSGRSAAIKREVSDIIFAKAEALFSASSCMETEITVEVCDLDKDNYHKITINQ